MALKNSKGYFAPGTYEFKKVFLRDHDIDIRFKVIEINIYESIFQPCMTADVTIFDTENMVANYPIVEGDVLDIHLVCNPEDKIQQGIDGSEIKCVMEIIKVTSRVKTSNQDMQSYTLRLASVGWSNNVRTRISRAYNNKTYADMVQDIFDDKFVTEGSYGLRGEDSKFEEEDIKPLDKEDTYGEYSVIIPRWKPIQAFNWLSGRSQSKDNKDAVNYVFFENKESYNFKSVSTLIEQGSTETYYVKLANVDETDERNYVNIFSYSYEDTGDILLNASNGTFGSRLIVHNMMTKEVDDHFPQGAWSLNYNIHGYPANEDEFGVIGVDRFGYSDEFDKTSHTDSNMLIPDDVADTISENPGNTRLLVHSNHRFQYDGLKTNHPEDWMRQRIMQKPQANYIRLTVNAIGNFKRKAGEVITIDLPSPEENKGIKDVRLKGDYLVTAIRRIFKPSSHIITMECIKDSFAGEE